MFHISYQKPLFLPRYLPFLSFIFFINPIFSDYLSHKCLSIFKKKKFSHWGTFYLLSYIHQCTRVIKVRKFYKLIEIIYISALYSVSSTNNAIIRQVATSMCVCMCTCTWKTKTILQSSKEIINHWHFFLYVSHTQHRRSFLVFIEINKIKKKEEKWNKRNKQYLLIRLRDRHAVACLSIETFLWKCNILCNVWWDKMMRKRK